MIKVVNGKQSIELITDENAYDQGTWFFCQNGYQSTGIDLSVEQFDILKELVNNFQVVEYYEKQRKRTTTNN